MEGWTAQGTVHNIAPILLWIMRPKKSSLLKLSINEKQKEKVPIWKKLVSSEEFRRFKTKVFR